MKKTNLIIISLITVLLASGIFVADAYSAFTPNPSRTQGNLGSQGTTLQLQSTTSLSDSSTLMVSSTRATGQTSVSGWPLYCYYYSIQTIPISQAISTMSTPPSNAKIFQNNDTIRFAGSQITILAVGMMPDDATNMTGMSPPSYATDDVFVIYGLIDPTIVVQSGAHVNLVFVNLDDDMYHNYVVTSLAPPYSYMPMQGMMWSNSSSWYGGMMGGLGMMGGGSFNTIFANMMPVLSPTNTNQGIAYYYATTFTMNNYGGSYWYICTYPGHAESGMYGKILVGA